MNHLQTQKLALSALPPLSTRYVAVYHCPVRGDAIVVIAQMKENRTFRLVAEGRAREMQKAFDKAVESALARVAAWERDTERQRILQDLLAIGWN
jgi:hypothetical protein